jgi:hypothetical protein
MNGFLANELAPSASIKTTTNGYVYVYQALRVKVEYGRVKLKVSTIP